MLPWRNSWFQIAFFTWVVSGALLILDYTPKIPASSAWINASHSAPRRSPEPSAKPLPPNGQHSPAKGAAPERHAVSPASEKPSTKTLDARTPATLNKSVPLKGSSLQANLNIISGLLTSHPHAPWRTLIDS